MSKTSYDKAYKELLEILDLIESQNVGIDDLNKKLKRAADLILFCKKRLRDTEDTINSLSESLEND